MSKFSILLLAFSILLFMACSNDDEGTQVPEEETNYFALTVGNSWTYKLYRFNNSVMEYEAQDLMITNSIVGTETINGETYFRYEATSQGADECQICLDDLGNKSVRDSLGYLVDGTGVKRFTVANETPYLLFTSDVGSVFGEYNPAETTVETPDGTVSNLDKNTYYLEMDDGTTAAGKDANYYRDGEGLIVKEISTVSSPNPLYILTLTESTIAQN